MLVGTLKRFPRLSFSFFLILALSIIVLIVELVLRAFNPLQMADIQRSFKYDERLGYRYKSSINIAEVSDHRKEDRISNLGTAGFLENVKPYPQRIYAIGDSYTKGTGVPVDAAYPFQLDLFLNIDSSGLYQSQYAVLNLGVPGYGAEQSLLSLQSFAETHGAPNFIVFLGSENDAEDDQLFLSGYKHRHMVAESPYWGRWFRQPVVWVSQTEIGKRAKYLVSVWRKRKIVTHREAQLPSDYPSVAERQLERFQALKRNAQEYNARLILSWSYAPSRSYDWLKSWCETNDVLFADWHSSVESVLEAMPAAERNNPHSGGHQRGWVLQQIAATVASQIVAVEADSLTKEE